MADMQIAVVNDRDVQIAAVVDGQLSVAAVGPSDVQVVLAAPGTSTDLSYNAATRLLSSSTGTDVTLPEATTSLPGLMAAADKAKVDTAASIALAAGLAIALG
jgi:hypothetical protein